jgi:hypothetical protein
MNKASSRKNRSICLPISKADYMEQIYNASEVRRVLTRIIAEYPELFPPEIAAGFCMKDIRVSKKLAMPIRRIEVAGTNYTLRPSFIMPHSTGWTDEVEKALFLRKFNVPFWALAHLFGKDPTYWYRLENQLGRNSIVGTTVKHGDKIPDDLAADEKHTWIGGNKCYVATTVASECILGVSIAENAGEDALRTAYGVFKQELQCIKPDYQPKTVNTDGWSATQKAWKTLFSSIVLICCFLHVYVKIRDRAKKKHRPIFLEVATRLWNCYHAQNRSSFSQRVRRLVEWGQHHGIPDTLLAPLKKLNDNRAAYANAYEFPGAHRTSNMLDRLMQRMDQHLFCTRYFHGSISSAELNIRGWALIHNFAPSNPLTVRKYGNGLASPAERLNKKRYHHSWLQNLLVSASLRGFSAPPPNP